MKSRKRKQECSRTNEAHKRLGVKMKSWKCEQECSRRNEAHKRLGAKMKSRKHKTFPKERSTQRLGANQKLGNINESVPEGMNL
jgi:hypothetical protein